MSKIYASFSELLIVSPFRSLLYVLTVEVKLREQQCVCTYVHVMIVMKMEMMMMIIIILLKMFSSSQAFRIIDSQKLDVPVWSLSTINQDQQISQSSNNMNLITYAYPVSIKPKVKWAISLYKGSLTHRNFKASRWGMLQRLTTKHMNAFTILGKQSGYIINKIEALTNLGYDLTTTYLSHLLPWEYVTVSKPFKLQDH